MNNLDKFANELLAGKVVFFAGSGISYESNLPSAHEILSHTVNALLPNLNNLEVSKLCNIQPEIFYEVILGLTQSIDSLFLWRSFYPEELKRFSIYAVPNLVHLFIVELSYKNRLPIFTTNFDNMFELAAGLLNIPFNIKLPTDNPGQATSNNILSICKLHGSIQNKEGEYTPQSLATTMTAITRMNIQWLDYIANTMRKTYLCFVGYSGRDIDLFPHITAFSQTETTLPIFWVNRFTNCYSDIASKMCAAIRVENVFPSEAFRRIIIDRKLNTQAMRIVKSQDKSKYHENHKEYMLACLTKELSNRVILNNDEQDFLYGQLTAKLGFYSDAIIKLQRLNVRDSSLNYHQKLELLLGCARLSHEVSKYISCKNYAKYVLQCKRDIGFTDIDIEIQARCLLSESLRMNIPADPYFPNQESVMLRLFGIYTLIHFIVTHILNAMKLLVNKKKFNQLSPSTQHEMLEHEIRFWGLIQSRWIRKTQSGIMRKIFVAVWNRLRYKCQLHGYASGIANTGKYYFRIAPDYERANEAEKIFELMTDSTGKELSMRNLADQAMENHRFPEAEFWMREFIAQAHQSGNRLNEAKGLLGLARINSEKELKPLLNANELERLQALFSEIEGNFWKRYFDYICRKYLN